MSVTILTKTYTGLPVNRKEILRYSGCPVNSYMPIIDECLAELPEDMQMKLCYTVFDAKIDGENMNLGFTELSSKSLAVNLKGCEKICLFAATAGISIDRLIRKYTSTSPSKALIFQAIGAERIETVCNTFCAEFEEEMRKDGFTTRPRFSPGFGDFPLSYQKDIFAVLDCPRKIGATLNDSMLMSPSKSVTALIGIRRQEDNV